MERTRKHKDHLDERLKDSAEAVGYLNAVLEDDDPRIFLLALRDVVDARGGLRQQRRLHRPLVWIDLAGMAAAIALNGWHQHRHCRT